VHIGGDAVEIKTEAVSSDVTDRPYDAKPTTGMFAKHGFISLCGSLFR